VAVTLGPFNPGSGIGTITADAAEWSSPSPAFEYLYGLPSPTDDLRSAIEESDSPEHPATPGGIDPSVLTRNAEWAILRDPDFDSSTSTFRCSRSAYRAVAEMLA
jgi:hypothetical protein